MARDFFAGATMFRSMLMGLTTFLFIFGWKTGELADLILIVSAALIACSFIRGHLLTEKVTIRVTIVLGLLSIYSLAIVILNGLFDTQIALRSLRALINFLGGLALTGLYYERDKSAFSANIIRDIYFSLAAHAAIMLAMYLNTGLRSAIYEFTRATDYVNINSSFLEGYRISGLTYGLSQTSVLQMLALLLLPLAINACTSYSGKFLALMGVPLLVISVLISGRSGLMLGLLFLLPATIVLLTTQFRNTSHVGLAKILFKYGFALLFIASSLYFIYGKMPAKFTGYSLNLAQEIFLAIELRGNFCETISNMFFLPDSWLELFFGSSNLGRGSLEYIPSDVGWIKTIFAIGVTGTLLMAAPYLIALKVAFNIKQIDGYLATVCFMVFLSALILQTKELALLTRNQWSVHVLLLTMLCFKQSVEPTPAKSEANVS